MNRNTRSVRSMDATMLGRLNSATKYPSIPTYHALDPKRRGRLTDALGVEFPEGGNVEAYEKIDGTNCRLIFPPDGDYPLIGSRTELLTFLSDVIHNPSQGIVSAVRDTTARLHETGDLADEFGAWTVIYGEVYGGKVGAHAEDYTGDGVTTGFRVFDIACVPADVLDRDREDIAAWRDNGGQAFWDSFDRREAAMELKLETVPLVGIFGSLPTSPEDTWRWLRAVSTTSKAALDDNARKASEGVVVRTPDRTRIAKIRHEDYRRTLGTGG
jgi:hypothetical protein